MSKKGQTAKVEATEPEEEYYGNVYEIGTLTLSGTFTDCTININTGAPPQPPPKPPGQ